MVRALVLLAALVLARPLTPPSRGDAPPRVVVVVSSDADPYRQALAGLRRELPAAGATLVVVLLHGDTARVPDAVAAIRTAPPPTAVVTLGTLATHAILARVSDVPLVAGMILNPGELGGAGNATGVYLEYPVDVELEWMRRVLPGLGRVGVVYHSAESGRRVTEARRGATVQAIRIASPAELPDALQQLTNRADVLWSLNDPVVYNAETARSLVLFSLRNRIPMVGQSAAWVRAGALYALERDYDDVGAQCAQLIARVLAGAPVGQLPPVPPRKVRYAVNRRTAADLGLVVPDAVLRGATEVIQ